MRVLLLLAFPAVLDTVQVYVPPSVVALMPVMFSVSDVALSMSWPFLCHWNVFPGPPMAEQVKEMSSPKDLTGSCGITVTLPSGDTAKGTCKTGYDTTAHLLVLFCFFVNRAGTHL